MRYKCTTCKGEYDETGKDGLMYYHACPPELDIDEKYVERANKRDENVGSFLRGNGCSLLK